MIEGILVSNPFLCLSVATGFLLLFTYIDIIFLIWLYVSLNQHFGVIRRLLFRECVISQFVEWTCVTDFDRLQWNLVYMASVDSRVMCPCTCASIDSCMEVYEPNCFLSFTWSVMKLPMELCTHHFLWSMYVPNTFLQHLCYLIFSIEILIIYSDNSRYALLLNDKKA